MWFKKYLGVLCGALLISQPALAEELWVEYNIKYNRWEHSAQIVRSNIVEESVYGESYTVEVYNNDTGHNEIVEKTASVMNTVTHEALLGSDESSPYNLLYMIEKIEGAGFLSIRHTGETGTKVYRYDENGDLDTAATTDTLLDGAQIASKIDQGSEILNCKYKLDEAVRNNGIFSYELRLDGKTNVPKTENSPAGLILKGIRNCKAVY